MNGENVIHTPMWILISHKKEILSLAPTWMNLKFIHVKQKKSGTERQEWHDQNLHGTPKISIVIMYQLNLILISECKDVNKSKTSLEFTDFGIESYVETNLCHHLFLKWPLLLANAWSNL